MGFVPIFITLGGFVLLFSLLVNYNMGAKRKRYLALLDELRTQLDHRFSQPLPSDLKGLEYRYQELKKGTSVSSEGLERLGKLLQDAKRARHQYLQLIGTKPYEFVAKLFGHRPI
ncbi:hypothetical protein [Lunatimonas salinarum]|uniref:hypothetical protein n=1 Tax=Lunatimonas salinarum TaxID=1774590 RepID=UPI001ADF81B1|nr:hypothetical protein [Lunatimonas salinarum]